MTCSTQEKRANILPVEHTRVSSSVDSTNTICSRGLAAWVYLRRMRVSDDLEPIKMLSYLVIVVCMSNGPQSYFEHATQSLDSVSPRRAFSEVWHLMTRPKIFVWHGEASAVRFRIWERSKASETCISVYSATTDPSCDSSWRIEGKRSSNKPSGLLPRKDDLVECSLVKRRHYPASPCIRLS